MKRLMILVFFTSLFMVPGQSFALSCAEPPAMDIAIRDYDAVVIGTVQSIDDAGGAKKLRVDVDRSYKGVEVNKITVYEDPTWGESREGATYLFFLRREKEKWLHPLCSPTTHNTGLAEEYFTGQKEMPLHAVDSYASDPDNPLVIVMISALLLGIAGAIVWILIFRKRKNA